MKLISIPDIHGHFASLTPLLNLIGEVDLVLLPGDITNFGRREAARKIVEPILEVNPHVLAVPGNCDRSFIEMHDPLACFTGHIHEGRGIDHIGTCPIVNPAPPGRGRYAWAEYRNGKLKVEIRSIRK